MQQHYETGYALSGGFIKGFAHLGAMQALVENDLRPQIISGVSAGALAGVFYADGTEPYRVVEFFEEKAFSDFTKWSLRSRGGFMELDLLYDFLHTHLKARRIEELKVPLVVTATDLDHGKSVQFRQGPIAERIAASCCVPGLFTPINIDGVNYVDGGVFMNLPVSTIRRWCDKVIAVNVSPLLAEDYKLNVINVLQRTYHFMSHSNIMIDRRLADILIEPANLCSYSNKELNKAKEIFDSGYKTTLRVLEEKKNLGRSSIHES